MEGTTDPLTDDPTRGQLRPAEAAETASGGVRTADRAALDALEIQEEINEYGVTPARLREVARLHLESAGRRAVRDRRWIASVRTAGLYLAAVDPPRAAGILADAGDAALAMTDGFTAAHLYLDAALILGGDAQPLEDPAQIEELLAKVKRCARAVDAGQRAEILERLAGARPSDISM